MHQANLVNDLSYIEKQKIINQPIFIFNLWPSLCSVLDVKKNIYKVVLASLLPKKRVPQKETTKKKIRNKLIRHLFTIDGQLVLRILNGQKTHKIMILLYEVVETCIWREQQDIFFFIWINIWYRSLKWKLS